MTTSVSNLVFLDNLDVLYGVNMSEHNGKIEYLGTTMGNSKNTQKDHVFSSIVN